MQALEKENPADHIDGEVEKRVGSDSAPSGFLTRTMLLMER